MGGRGAARREGGRTPSGKSLSDFQRMDMFEMGEFFKSLENIKYPKELNDSPTQKVAYALGINDKPEIVSDEELDKLIAEGATPLYRAVDKDEYHDMMFNGDATWLGHGPYYGDGLYFGNWASGTEPYGSQRIRMVLNKNAKIVDFNTVKGWQDDMHNHAENYVESNKYFAFDEELSEGRAVAKMTESHMYGLNPNAGITALQRGYNVIRVQNANMPGEDFYVVLDRKAMTTSRTITKQKSWKD